MLSVGNRHTDIDTQTHLEVLSSLHDQQISVTSLTQCIVSPLCKKLEEIASNYMEPRLCDRKTRLV